MCLQRPSAAFFFSKPFAITRKTKENERTWRRQFPKHALRGWETAFHFILVSTESPSQKSAKMKKDNRPHPRKVGSPKSKSNLTCVGTVVFLHFGASVEFSSQKVNQYSQTTFPTHVNIKIRPCPKNNIDFPGLMPRSKTFGSSNVRHFGRFHISANQHFIFHPFFVSIEQTVGRLPPVNVSQKEKWKFWRCARRCIFRV